MSYDEQPDGDIHGECAAEIHALTAERDALKKDSATAWDNCEERRKENEALAAQNQEMREQFSKILTMPSSMCWPIARDGLASKNIAEEVLKRRDAKVLRSVTKGLDPSCGCTENILFIADELEQGE